MAHVERQRLAKEKSMKHPLEKLNLDGDINDILAELDTQSDHGAALIGANLVEIYLLRAMMSRMIGMNNILNVMFYGQGAPLNTFSSRIYVAHAIGILGPISFRHINIIREIRNKFAHEVRRIDFSHPPIKKMCDQLIFVDDESWKPNFSEERRRFTSTVVSLSAALESFLVRNRDYTFPPTLD